MMDLVCHRDEGDANDADDEEDEEDPDAGLFEPVA